MLINQPFEVEHRSPVAQRHLKGATKHLIDPRTGLEILEEPLYQETETLCKEASSVDLAPATLGRGTANNSPTKSRLTRGQSLDQLAQEDG